MKCWILAYTTAGEVVEWSNAESHIVDVNVVGAYVPSGVKVVVMDSVDIDLAAGQTLLAY